MKAEDTMWLTCRLNFRQSSIYTPKLSVATCMNRVFVCGFRLGLFLFVIVDIQAGLKN